jgi:hypothetical protein
MNVTRGNHANSAVSRKQAQSFGGYAYGDGFFQESGIWAVQEESSERTTRTASNAAEKGTMSTIKSLMRATQLERTGGVQHPLAKYNNVGKLTCKLCAVAVGSDALWPAHIRSPGHVQATVVLFPPCLGTLVTVVWYSLLFLQKMQSVKDSVPSVAPTVAHTPSRSAVACF